MPFYRCGGGGQKPLVAEGESVINGNNGNTNGAIVDVGFKPDVIFYSGTGNSSFRISGFWEKSMGKTYITNNEGSVSTRSFATSASTGNRGALGSVTDTGFMLYGAYQSGKFKYWACKLDN